MHNQKEEGLKELKLPKVQSEDINLNAGHRCKSTMFSLYLADLLFDLKGSILDSLYHMHINSLNIISKLQILMSK